MLGKLLGNQVILGDHQLLLITVGAEFDDLHTVQKGPGHGIQRIGGGDEHHVGKVKGNLQVMIPIGMVLLGIQDLQQCGAGVTPIVGSHFVNFVQQQHRVRGTCLGYGRHNSSGHGAHIGFAVTPDIRLIMDTTQRNPNHFPIQAPGDGIGDGSFAHTGRTHQAENLGRHMRSQLPDGNGFQDPLLYLFQAEVVMLQNFGGRLDIDPLLGGFIPGQIQHGVQVAAQDRSLRRAERLLSQLLHVLQKLLLILLFQMEAFDFGDILIKILIVLPFSQFIPDDTHLIAQVVIPLILVDGGTGFILDLRLQLEHLDFPGQVSNGHFQPAGRIELQQQLGLLREIQAGILSHGIRHKAVLIAGHHTELNHLGRMLRELHISIIKGAGLPAQSLASGGIRLLRARNGLYHGREEGLGLPHFHDPGPGDTGDQHPQILIWGIQQLLDLDHRTHGIEVCQLGIIHQEILLGNQKQHLVLFHGSLQRKGRLGSAHVKVDRLLRENCQPAQGKHRHQACIANFRQGIIPPYWIIEEGDRNLPPSYLSVLSGQLFSGMVGIPENGGRCSFHALRRDDHLLNGQVRRNLIHDSRHDLLHDGPQPPGTDFPLQSLLSNCLQGLIGDLQRNAVHLQQCLILLGQGVLGLHHDADQVLLGQALQIGDDGHTAHQLRNNAELQQIMGLHLGQDLAHIPLFPALHRCVEADGGTIRAGLDDFIQSVERAAADEQDVGGVDLDHFLLGVLAATLRRNTGNGTLQNLQQCLLDALTGNVTGDGGIFALAGDFIHLINVDNAGLSTLYIKVSGLKKTKQDIFHIIAHIACFRERGRIGNGERNIQDFGQGLRKEGFAGTCGTNQQNVALLQLHIGVAAKINTFVVIVYSDGQRDLCFFLTDDVMIHECFDLHGGRQLIHGGFAAPAHIDLIPQQIVARVDTIAADIHSWAGNQLRSLILPLPAEAAANLLFRISCHEPVTSFLKNQ